jgi:hypothetical protein
VVSARSRKIAAGLGSDGSPAANMIATRLRVCFHSVTHFSYL